MSFTRKAGFIEDRFTQGLIAGFAGWIPQVLFTYFAYWVVHWTQYAYLDFAAIITYNHRPNGFIQYFFSELVVIIVLMFLGAIFAMLIKGCLTRRFLLDDKTKAGNFKALFLNSSVPGNGLGW